MVNRETGGVFAVATLYQQGMKTLGERIRAARELIPDFSQQDLADKVGVKQQTVNDLESGRSRTTKFILEFAAALDQDPEWLRSGKGDMRPRAQVHGNVTRLSKTEVPWVKNFVMVKLVGAVQAGVWGPALEWSDDDHREIFVTPHPLYAGLPMVAFEVIGPSMNKYYPHKTPVICISYIDLGEQPKNGDHVLVQHWKDDLVEATVKEFVIEDDGTRLLYPRSFHPDFQKPMKLVKPPKGEEIRITHKVVQAVISRV